MTLSDRDTRERAREAAARIRAARSYAGLTQQQLVDRMELSLATMKRIESGTRPISTDELLHVGEACDFPAAFMLHGPESIGEHLNGDRPPVACVERFADIERRLAVVETLLGDLGQPAPLSPSKDT